MSGVPEPGTWILCETRKRYFSLSRSNFPGVQVFTALDACVDLLRQLWTLANPTRPHPRFLKDIESAFALHEIARQFGWSFQTAAATKPGLPWHLKSLIDPHSRSYRLADSSGD